MKMKKIWSALIGTLLFSLVLLGLIAGISLLPINGNYRFLIVMSGSMEPEVPIGDLIFVRPIDKYKVGDVITYKSQKTTTEKGNIITHRIIDIKNDGESKNSYFTQGDANDTPDFKPVNREQIIGKMFFKIPLLGYILAYTKTTLGLILLIIIPATVVIYEEIKKIKKEGRKIVDDRRIKKHGEKKGKKMADDR